MSDLNMEIVKTYSKFPNWLIFRTTGIFIPTSSQSINYFQSRMTKVLISLLVLLFVTFTLSYGFEDFEALVEDRSLDYSSEASALGYDSSFIQNIQEELFSNEPLTTLDLTTSTLPTNVEEINALTEKLVAETFEANPIVPLKPSFDLKKVQLPVSSTNTLEAKIESIPRPVTPVPVIVKDVQAPQKVLRVHREKNVLETA